MNERNHHFQHDNFWVVFYIVLLYSLRYSFSQLIDTFSRVSGNFFLTGFPFSWWLCKNKHIWQSTIANRVQGNRCPDCSKSRASSSYNLAIANPSLAFEWHPSLNEGISASQVTPGSRKKVWWLCPKGHNYQAMVYNRNTNKSNCPYCAGEKAETNTNLNFKFPELSAQWHPTKNLDLFPNQFLPGSNKKIWWICKHNHEWEATISNRTNHKSGCPFCARQVRSRL